MNATCRRMLLLVTAAVLLGPVSIARTATLTRGPYLQLGTPSSVVVRWRTDVPTDSRVRYGLDQHNLPWQVDGSAQTTEHEVTLSNLVPNTRYFYVIGSSSSTLPGQEPQQSFLTAPEPGTRRPTRVWVIGDSGTADANAAKVRDAYLRWTGTRPTDLWILLGDNAYPNGTDSEYQAAVFDMYGGLLKSSVAWPTLGNHDGHTADSASQSGAYYEIFTLPKQGEAGGLASGTEAYYSFDFGDIHFICLESYETDRSKSGAMMTWLEQDLADTTENWIVAFWHHPPYSRGSHLSDFDRELIEMRENALPILESYGVDLVLSGHSHSYERSFLLDGHYGKSNTLTSAMILDNGDGRPNGTGAYQKPTGGSAPNEGAVYVVAGSSGKTTIGLLNHPAMHVSLKRLGSLVLDIDGDALDATFLDETGGIQDEFTILKGPASATVGVAN